MHKHKKLRKSVFGKILLFSVIPVAILFVISVAVLVIQADKIKTKSINQYSERLEYSSEMIGKGMQEIINSIDFLCYNKSIFTKLTVRQSGESVSESLELKNILTEYKNSNDLIDSAAIYFKDDGYVVSNTGRSSFGFYLKNKASFKEYDFKNVFLEEIPVSGYRILGPAKNENSDEYVIPIIVGAAKKVKTVNYLIVNVKCSELISILSSVEADKDAVYALFDKSTDTKYFSHISGSLNVAENEICEDITGKIFETKINKKSYICISEVDKSAVTDNFIYAVMIPERIVFSDFYISLVIMFVLMAFLALIDILVCYYFSKKIYTPIGKITKYIGSTEYMKDSALENEFEIILEGIKTIINKNLEMSDNIKSNLSILQENYMYKFLKSSREPDEDEISSLLGKTGMSFEFDDYVVAIIRLKFNDEFYKTFNKTEYSSIMKGLSSILSVMCLESNTINSFLMHPNDEHFILIINADEEKLSGNIHKKLSEFIDNFYQDKDLMQIFVGIGNTYRGFEGMRCSYNEAENAVAYLVSLNESNVFVYKRGEFNKDEYIYTMEDENTIYNHILNGDYYRARAKMSEIYAKNLDKHISRSGLRNLYTQFYNTALKVLNIKNISPVELMEEKWIDIVSDSANIDDESFIDFVDTVIKKASEYIPVRNTGIDIEEMKKYIDEHFAEEIYLDKMAEIFGVNSKYLSRVVKEQMGINFAQYVMGVRVAKTKELLAKTQLSVSEIMEKTGFNSRNTFVRAFKKFEGITPSEYRNLNIKGKKD